MKNNFLNNKIVERYKMWFLIPLVIVLIGFIVFMSVSISSIVKATNSGTPGGEAVGDGINDGFNIGIDFESGTLLTVTLGKKGAVDEFKQNSKTISDIIAKHGLKVSYTQKTNSDSDALASIVFKYDEVKGETDVNQLIADDIMKEFPNADVKSTSIGSSASSRLITSAVLAVIISTILILIYVIIRFEFWSAISAVLALMHDVLMMLTLTVIFRVQINSSFIAAAITIVAYSINATIVLFDRVRENYKLYKPGADLMEYNRAMCNKSIKETFTRNINTTVTTLVAITVLAIIGDLSIREFALPVIFGLIAGCYSSMVISPSIFVLLKNKFSKETRDDYKKLKAEKKANKAKPVAEVKEIA